MTPVRKRRLIVTALVLSAASIATFLIVLALQSNVTYLHTPSEVHAAEVPSATFRLGGLVREGSLKRTPGSLQVEFVVTDLHFDVPVRFGGILPDLFREGQSVIARGQMRDGAFVAEEILAKHDEAYMPKEVKDAMDKAKAEGRAAPHAPQAAG